MPPLREADRHVVCGACEIRIPASLLVCPACHSYPEVDNKGLGHLDLKIELVEVVRT